MTTETQDELGMIAVRLRSSRAVTLHLLRDPAKVPADQRFTAAHPTVCGQHAQGDALPQDYAVREGTPRCQVCSLAAISTTP